MTQIRENLQTMEFPTPADAILLCMIRQVPPVLLTCLRTMWQLYRRELPCKSMPILLISSNAPPPHTVARLTDIYTKRTARFCYFLERKPGDRGKKIVRGLDHRQRIVILNQLNFRYSSEDFGWQCLSSWGWFQTICSTVWLKCRHKHSQK